MVVTIIERGADYVLPLKGNQDSLLSDARAEIGTAKKPLTAETKDEAHGRIERRRAVVVKASHLADHHEFAGLTAIGMIEATRTIDGKTETVVRYFALSRTFKPAALLRIVRAHWGIENRLHWTLDVVLDEDLARTRKDHGPANLAILRRLALNIARNDRNKGSLAGKLRRAAWNDDNLVKLPRQMR